MRYRYTNTGKIRNLRSRFRGFEPNDITNLAAWYKGDVGVTLSGAAVTQWDDQSGNGRHMVAKRPPRATTTAWSAGTYHTNQTVTHSNSIWTCDAANTTTEPGVAGWTAINAASTPMCLWDIGTAYTLGDYVFWDPANTSSLWRANQNTDAADTPGVSDKWTEMTDASFRPATSTRNGLTVIDFTADRTNGVFDCLTDDGETIIDGSALSCFIVCKWDNASLSGAVKAVNDFVVDGMGAAIADRSRLNLGAATSSTKAVWGASLGMSAADMPNDTFNVHNFIGKTGVSDTAKQYIDGVLVDSNTAIVAAKTLYIQSMGSRVSDPTNMDGYFDGQVAEYVLYDRILSDIERQEVEGCLQRKWGI